MGISTSRVFWEVISDGGEERWVTLRDDVIVPARTRMRIVGGRGAPDCAIEFEVSEGIPEAVAIQWSVSPKGRGIRRSDLDELGNPEALARLAFSLFARRVDLSVMARGGSQPINPYQEARAVLDWQADLQGTGIVEHLRGEHSLAHMLESVGIPSVIAPGSRREATNRALDAAFKRKREVTHAELEQVAEVYKRNLDNNPTDAVRRYFGYSHRTASRRVQQARDTDPPLLPPTTQGRKLA